MNAPGKTKDSINSGKDLKELCCRKELELNQAGKAPIPIFRLNNQGKTAIMKWIKEDLQFPDGYASKISRCVDAHGMKSHDYHVLK